MFKGHTTQIPPLHDSGTRQVFHGTLQGFSIRFVASGVAKHALLASIEKPRRSNAVMWQ
jgi:hypothetical protein